MDTLLNRNSNKDLKISKLPRKLLGIMGNVSGKGVNEFRGDLGEATTISPPKAAKPSLKEVFSVLVGAFSQ